MTDEGEDIDVKRARGFRRLTVVFLSTSVLGLLIWDIYVANNDVKNDTISEVVRDVSHEFWVIPFALMAVMGHLFWNTATSAERRARLRFKTLMALVGAVGLRDLVNLQVDLPTFFATPLVVGIVGFLLGAWLWPQHYGGKEAVLSVFGGGDGDGSLNAEG